LVKILADDLENNQFSSLLDFIASQSYVKLTRRGKRIEIPGLANNKRVKFLLRKFLHANHLSEYGALDHGDALEIVHVKFEPERRMRKSLPLKHPVPYGPRVPCFVKPRLAVEWQGKPPTKKARSRK
jgi:hypothetical protein